MGRNNTKAVKNITKMYEQALEAALIRLHLERGWLPYCFVAPDNVPSLSLQAKLGLTNIHIPAIWLF